MRSVYLLSLRSTTLWLSTSENSTLTDPTRRALTAGGSSSNMMTIRLVGQYEMRTQCRLPLNALDVNLMNRLRARSSQRVAVGVIVGCMVVLFMFKSLSGVTGSLLWPTEVSRVSSGQNGGSVFSEH